MVLFQMIMNLVFLIVSLLSFTAVSWGQAIPTSELRVIPRGTGAGETGLTNYYELTANGEGKISWKAPDALAASTGYTWPPAFPGGSNFALVSTTSGVTSWVATVAGPPTGVAGGSLSGTYPNPALAATQPDAHTWSSNQTLAGTTILSNAAGGLIVSNTADASDSKSNTFGGGGAAAITRGGFVTVYGNEHSTVPGAILMAPGNVTNGGIFLLNRTGVLSMAFLDQNLILGLTGDTFPTSCINCMNIGSSTAPSANPAGTVTSFWSDPTTGLGYRSAISGEGQGVTNSVHNRFEQTAALGTVYTFTTSMAKVAFGTTSPEVTLPTAGTWLILARISIQYSAATTANEAITVKIRNVTDAVDLAGSQFAMGLGTYTTITENFHSGEWSGISTVTAASKNIQIFGQLSGAVGAGSIQAVSGYMRAMRLY